ncbi:hypothetical protein VM1G_11914 [Cytospora mali]|uniref:Uncharacterized protein n=1 Tax=Cytospora mali TaxID=578113 RepID=A0A194WA30_CYTMA|nr:hypothetical protein VM1G_11914 [Valsa mali]
MLMPLTTRGVYPTLGKMRPLYVLYRASEGPAVRQLSFSFQLLDRKPDMLETSIDARDIETMINVSRCRKHCSKAAYVTIVRE